MKKLLVFVFALPTLVFAQSVKGTFSPAKDYSYAFLYKSSPNGADYINRGELDSLGRFEIKLDSTVTAGIYKIVYAIPPEENNFDFIYDGKENVAFDFSIEKGVVFRESEENKLWDSYLKSIDMVNQTISNYYSKDIEDKVGFNAIFKVLKDTQLAYEESSEGKLVSNFIVANRPYIPQQYEDLSTYSEHLKQHFFSQVDFSNYLLQSATFLVERVNTYVFNTVKNPSNAIYKQHIDDVANAIGNKHLIIKTRLLENQWQQFVRKGNHSVANYISDKHLLALAHKTENKVLAQMLTSYKNTSIGAKAPNFDINTGETKSSLHQLESAKHYVLVFWSSTCGHCLNELPKIKALAAKKPNLKVVAFGLEKEAESWDKAIKDYPNFTHVIGLKKWENPIVNTYGITGTPTYFILDENKIIVNKPFSIEDLELALNNL